MLKSFFIIDFFMNTPLFKYQEDDEFDQFFSSSLKSTDIANLDSADKDNLCAYFMMKAYENKNKNINMIYGYVKDHFMEPILKKGYLVGGPRINNISEIKPNEMYLIRISSSKSTMARKLVLHTKNIIACGLTQNAPVKFIKFGAVEIAKIEFIYAFSSTGITNDNFSSYDWNPFS